MSIIENTKLHQHLIPSLENGDLLTADDFLERWDHLPHIKHAELINRIVYMNAASRSTYHGIPQNILSSLLWTYSTNTPGTFTASGATVIFDQENVLEPDIYLAIDEKHQGQSHINEQGFLEQAPELIVEIAASSVNRDLHLKKHVYEKFGVKEYIVWRTEDSVIDWFVLENNSFVQKYATENLLKCHASPGLWLDLNALLNNQSKQALDTIYLGLASSEYAEFKLKLAQQKLN